MAAGLLLQLKAECEAQHARAEAAEAALVTMTAERDAAWEETNAATIARDAAERDNATIQAQLGAAQEALRGTADEWGELCTEMTECGHCEWCRNANALREAALRSAPPAQESKP